MRHHADKQQRRQIAYRRRAKRASLAAKLMIPLVFLGISAAAWSDPTLGPRLETGVNEVRPLVQSVIDGEPVMEVLAEATRWQPENSVDVDETLEQADIVRAASNGLPTSVVPINRPEAPASVGSDAQP